MFRRVLLSAALVAAAFAQQPAHAGEICMLTVTLTGTINKVIPVCFDYDEFQRCADGGTGPALQHVKVEVCVPSPVVQPS